MRARCHRPARTPLLVAVLLHLVAISSFGESSAPILSGSLLYQSSCTQCHGDDGSGREPSLLGFETPVPDFTDCSFASREPDADWIGVAHEGGPLRGFDRMMPAFGGLLSVEELQAIMDHIRTFCGDDSWPRGRLNLPRALVTEKAYPEDEAVFTIGVDAEGEGAISSSLIYEKRFGARNQIEIKFPFSWKEIPDSSAREGATRWTGGIGDLAVAVKRAFWHDTEKGSIFSAAAEVVLPTGDEDKGLGSGTAKFEPFLAFGQLLPADSFLHVQIGAEIPTDRDHDDEAFARLALGKTFTRGGPWGRAWTPMLEVLSKRDLRSGAETHWDLVPQVQVTLNQRQHVMLNLGARFPVDNRDTRDVEVLAYLLWDWFDGGFLEGW